MPSVTKKNIASSSKNKTKTKRQKSKGLDFLGFVDDSVGYSELIPFSNRFHLSAARDTARKVELGRKTNYTTESASALNSPNISALMDESLTYLEDPKFLKQFTTNSKNNRRIIIAENNYDDTTLWRIHDAYRTDGAVSRSLDTMVEAVVGRKRTSLILDTNDYYDNEDDELEALDEIKNNELYRKYVRDISKINKHLNMNTFEKMILTSVLIYGRAAILIEYDKDPLKFKDALPIALKSLASLRIGRVFYYADTWELAGVEYLDFKEDKRIVEPHRLIYYVNKDYHISPRTLHNGYSILEPVLDIAETNTLNRQTNIKEINKRLWAAFVIIKYFGKKKKDVENFIKNYKAGMPIIGNRDFEAQVVEVAHDLEKLIAQGLDADKKIARDLKIPIMLTGHDNEQAMATAGTVIHSWINFVLESARTDFRNVFEKQWIERLLLALINKNKELDKFLGLIKDSGENDNNNTQGYTVSDKQNKILNPIDLPFKIKLQFANFTIDTFLDKIAGVKALTDSGIITKIMALQELDRKEYIPEMRKVIEEQELQFQEMMEQENDFKQQEIDNKNSKENSRLPKVDAKAKSQADINNRKTKSSSAGSNNSLRSL
ncbi:MAG: hypothetical protein R2685_07965 [Candidatus Nitrosocosmicus sp.]|nr:hypothetical protein [Candidatus Nitrosocosmicus sp.]